MPHKPLKRVQGERFPPDDPREWLNRARSNLAQAQARIKGVYLEDLCFNAQQAAEKAIKGVLILNQVEFPYVHDIAELLGLVIEKALCDVPAGVYRAASLTRYAVMARYPGVLDPATEEQYEEAIAVAEATVRWAEGIIEPACESRERRETQSEVDDDTATD